MKSNFKYAVLFFLLIASNNFSFGQCDSCIIKIVSYLEKSKMYVVSSHVGYSGAVSQESLLFKKLLLSATSKQLEDVALNNKSVIVRLYALQALKQKDTTVSEAISNRFESDNTFVTMLDGCLAYEKTVKDLAMENLKFVNENKTP
jgi:hypothetical protein